MVVEAKTHSTRINLRFNMFQHGWKEGGGGGRDDLNIAVQQNPTLKPSALALTKGSKHHSVFTRW